MSFQVKQSAGPFDALLCVGQFFPNSPDQVSYVLQLYVGLSVVYLSGRSSSSVQQFGTYSQDDVDALRAIAEEPEDVDLATTLVIPVELSDSEGSDLIVSELRCLSDWIHSFNPRIQSESIESVWILSYVQINEFVKVGGDQLVLYYACEALYNIAKVVRGDFIIFFNQIFDALCKLSTDSAANVQSVAHLLGRLVKV
ncbi:hypothetical protein RJT34_22753 [Clitoria ternatea]|uniref:ARM repeat superfamily protein n=1 Tax=Clitoria ternatea TaxID=43366 RepID=A0AAN9FRK1_CLITE